MGSAVDKRLMVTGQRLEPRLDNVVEWSRGELGELEFGPQSATFKDWSIPYPAIRDAVINTERILFKKVQCLAIDAETGKYIFTLQEPIEAADEFPFSIRVTERRSAVGQFALFAALFFLSKCAWDVLKSSL